MRITFLQAVCATAALTMVAGCSGGGSSSIAPTPGSVGQSGVDRQLGRSFSVLPAKLQSRINSNHITHFVSHNSCPATGMIIYMSDFVNNVINIYDSSLTQCGQIAGLSNPQGMGVHNGNLYVANTGGENILAFHRGASTPYLTATDPSGQFPVDVKVAPDGIIIASNIFSPNTGIGSISTFTRKGVFVGNFPRADLFESYFITIFHNGTVYEDGFDNYHVGALFSLSCPAGNCGADTELGTPFSSPGGLTENKSNDLVATDQAGDVAYTFELPKIFPTSFFYENGGINVTIDTTMTRPFMAFAADALMNELVCYKYKQDGTSPGSCGIAAGSAGGQATGVAIDEGL